MFKGWCAIAFCFISTTLLATPRLIQITVSERTGKSFSDLVPVSVKIVTPMTTDEKRLRVFDTKGQVVPSQVVDRGTIPDSKEKILEVLWQTTLLPFGLTPFQIRFEKGPDSSVKAPLTVKKLDHGEYEITNSLMQGRLSSLLLPLQFSCGDVIVSHGFSESFHWLNPSQPDKPRVCGADGWKILETRVTESGPVRAKILTECVFEDSQRQEKWYRTATATLWANRGMMHLQIVYRNASVETKLMPRGESTYLGTWNVAPGGRMTTSDESTGKVFVALQKRGALDVSVDRLTDLLRQYSLWFTTDDQERWADFFERGSNTGCGIIYPNESPLAFGIYNSGYRQSPPEPRQPYWFLCLPSALRDKSVPPNEALVCEVIFVPHKGDWHSTQNAWYSLKAVEVRAEEEE